MAQLNSSRSATSATLLGIIACAIWSSAVLIMNLLASAFGMLRAGGLELLIGGAILISVALIRGDLPRIALHSRRCHAVCGTMWVCNLVLAWTAVATAKSSGQLLVTGLLNYLWPSLTLVLAIPILGKRATWWLAPGLVAVTVGILLGKLATTTETGLTGALTDFNAVSYFSAVLDALAWALYSNYSRKLSNPEGASAVPAYMTIAGVLLLCASSFSGSPHSPMWRDWILLLSWAALAALSYLFWDIGMRRGSVVAISTTSMLIPLLSTIITAVFSGHGISVSILTSGALVVVGSSICRRGVVDY